MRTRGVRYLNLRRKIGIIAHMSELVMLIVKSTIKVYTYPRTSPRYKFSALVVPLVGSSRYSHISLPYASRLACISAGKSFPRSTIIPTFVVGSLELK